MRRLTAILALAASALLIAACGGDSEEEALEKVCNAADDIEQQVGELSSLTLSTASIEGIEDSLNTIGEDLNTIDESLGDLREDEADQVEEAAQSLESTADTALNELGESQSLQQAGKSIERAFADLGTATQQLFASIDCPQG
jgi:archaellum component FlaC